MLVMVVLQRLLVLLLLALVATEGLRGQTRGAVDGGLGAAMLLVVIHVEGLLQVLGPHAAWAHCHLLQELHCRQKKKTKTRGNTCTRILYPLTKLLPDVLCAGYKCTR